MHGGNVFMCSSLGLVHVSSDPVQLELHSLTHSLDQLTHLIIHSLDQLTHLITHSLDQLTHLITHSLDHSLTHLDSFRVQHYDIWHMSQPYHIH